MAMSLQPSDAKFGYNGGKKGPWEGNKGERRDGKGEGREREASGRGESEGTWNRAAD